MTLPECPKWIHQTLEDMKAIDIQSFEVSQLTDVTDYMIVCSGTSSTQIKAIANKLIDASKENHLRPLGIEGLESAEWILVDLGDVVVHVMHPTARATYKLESLWKQTKANRESASSSHHHED